jgi:hypothetical protein
VRQSLFGYRKRSSSIRDGDRPGKMQSPLRRRRNGKPCIVRTALSPDGAKTCRVHRIGRPLREIRSTQPSSTTQCEPCQTATVLGWSGERRGKESPQARQRRPSRPTTYRVHRIGQPLQGVQSVKKGQRDCQEQSGVNRVRRRPEQAHKGGKEMEDSQSVPHRAASARRKVNATIKNNTV